MITYPRKNGQNSLLIREKTDKFFQKTVVKTDMLWYMCNEKKEEVPYDQAKNRKTDS